MTESFKRRKRIILDCDPGHDDAMAILLAAGHPDCELLAITTVAGNQTVDRTSLNARRVCTIAGVNQVPIAAGCSRPLVRPLQTAQDIHGETGLDGTEWGEPAVPLSETHAVDLIIDLVMRSPGEVTLVPTGPLTNIAMAVRREPRIASNVMEVVLMGGSYTRGNTTPLAEFNILVDPEAASVVFGQKWPVTMVGLDVTHQALATPDIFSKLNSVGTDLSRTLTEILAYFRETYRRKFDFQSPPVHDPCAVARVIRPDLVTCVEAFVAIELRGEWTWGTTVVDFDGSLSRDANARVATALDVDGFWEIMLGAISVLGRA